MKTRIFLLAVVVLAFATAMVAAEDPFVGTWKLNVAKSKAFSMSSPAMLKQSTTVILEKTDNGLKLTTDTVAADGKQTHNDDSLNLDGKSYANSTPQGSLRACTRVDTNSFICVTKLDSNEVGRAYYTVSNDGKMGNFTSVMRNAEGKEFIGVLVFDKQ